MPVRAFCKRYKAKSSGLRAEGISTLSTISTLFNSTFYILHFTFSRGAYATIAIIVSPWLALKEIKHIIHSKIPIIIIILFFSNLLSKSA